MNWIPVVLFSNRAEADSIQRRLFQTGVEARINDKKPLAKLWFISKDRAGVRVEVYGDKHEKAEHLLMEWDAADAAALRYAVRCPECGSLRVDYPQYAKHSLLTNLAMGLLSQLRVIEKDYYCDDCHFTWPKEGPQARRDRPHMAPYYFIEGVEQSRFESTGHTGGASERHREAV
jgi:hypothetical protein